jgi:hypothetical protein
MLQCILIKDVQALLYHSLDYLKELHLITPTQSHISRSVQPQLTRVCIHFFR